MLNSTKISAKFELNTELLSNIYLNLITIFSEPRCDYISPAVARRSAACGSPVILTSSSHASHLHHKRVAAHVRACARVRACVRALSCASCITTCVSFRKIAAEVTTLVMRWWW